MRLADTAPPNERPELMVDSAAATPTVSGALAGKSAAASNSTQCRANSDVVNHTDPEDPLVVLPLGTTLTSWIPTVYRFLETRVDFDRSRSTWY